MFPIGPRCGAARVPTPSIQCAFPRSRTKCAAGPTVSAFAALMLTVAEELVLRSLNLEVWHLRPGWVQSAESCRGRGWLA